MEQRQRNRLILAFEQFQSLATAHHYQTEPRELMEINRFPAFYLIKGGCRG